MNKSIVVIGSGSSAKRYIDHFLLENELVAILDTFGEGKINETPVGKINSILSFNFDEIIIASWAVNELALTLEKMGIPLEKINVFLNDKESIIPLSQWNNEVATVVKPNTETTLYAFYDLTVSYPTFDILGFICLAEMERIKRNIESIKFIIVYPESYTNTELLPLMAANEQSWRIRNILFPCCYLLDSCSGVDICSDRHKAKRILESEPFIFPNYYSLEEPTPQWKFGLVINEVNKGSDIGVLHSTPNALKLVDRWLAQNNKDNKKVIAITLRESSLQKLRNSNIQEWIKFIDQLDKEKYLPVIVRDIEESLNSEPLSKKCVEFNACAFNIELRMALYERSYINLGVNNGPSHLWVFNPNCRYIMYKQITENYHHSAAASFKERNFEIGGNFPGSLPFQRFVWEDDTFETINNAFNQLCRDIDDSVSS